MDIPAFSDQPGSQADPPGGVRSSDEARLYGQGLAFPPQVTAAGQLAWSSGPQNVRECLQILLLTQPGERLRSPDFGAGLDEFLFEPNTVSTHTQLESRIRQAIERWEPRVSLQAVEASADPDDPQAAVVALTYRLIATGSSERVQLQVPLGGGR